MADKWAGSFVAIITPFTDDDKVDYEALGALVEWHIAEGTDGIVPCGTTGESPTVSFEEHEQIIKFVIEKVAKRILVVAGAGANSTKEAVHLTQWSKDVGADAVLSVNPYYNKPTQEGLFLHFSAVAAVGIPVILYNIPGRSAVSMTPDTVARLSKLPNIVAIKEATGSVDFASEIASLCDIPILSGDDSLCLPIMSIGGKGVISVIANILPADVKALTVAANQGNLKEALRIHQKLYRLSKALFVETNPIPIKMAMSLVGKCKPGLRLPLTPMSAEHLPRLKAAMTEAGL
eukprot:CAMPEP_0114558980 /NCGR_PEP_ID=MMETSP0114-20121206/10681_1 /TAXON_ID=31324 /ORGANISM="Goniomonas sp, Strain m" /LENGTH=290 /DNA_ID=CAMNT_0001744427 /DNA_START=10 /DNA_END=882 /DNA_ORIENTATION=+